jgi:hypothetical protein
VLDHRLRHRRLVLAVLFVCGAFLVPAVLLTPGSGVDAEALVVARQLDMDVAALPRYGEAVFDNGQVAQAVADELGVAAVDVVPDRVSLAAEPDSLELRVGGPARIANTAADTFVSELNRPGVGVGQFALHMHADPLGAQEPILSDDSGSWTVAVPLGATALLVAGVVLAFTPRARS